MKAKDKVAPYQSSLPLLESMYSTIQQAAADDSQLRETHSENGDAFWPSMASLVYPQSSPTGFMYEKVEGTCLRQAYYKMTRVKETDATGARSIKAMTIGTVAEGIFKEWFHGVDGYRVVFPDIRGRKLRFNSLVNGIRVRGEVDVIMEHVETKTRFGVEVKTYDGSISAANLAGPDAAKECYKTWIPPDFIDDRAPFPKENNLLQAMLYLQEFWNDGIHLWKLVYGARDKGPDAEFDVSLCDINGKKVAVVNSKAYPEFNLDGIYSRFQTLKTHLENKTLPPKDYVAEYDVDYLLTGRIRGKSDIRSEAAHQLWRERLDAKVKNSKAKVKKTQAEVYKEAMSVGKADWQCSYCPFRKKCMSEPSDHSII